MAKDDIYDPILDEQDYDEIQENAAELPLTDKPAPARSQDAYYKGRQTVGLAAAAITVLFAVEIILSAVIGKSYALFPLNLILKILLAAAAVVCAVYSYRGKAWARYVCIVLGFSEVVLCGVRMVIFTKAEVALVSVPAALISIVPPMLMLSDKNAETFFGFHSRAAKIGSGMARKKNGNRYK